MYEMGVPSPDCFEVLEVSIPSQNNVNFKAVSDLIKGKEKVSRVSKVV